MVPNHPGPVDSLHVAHPPWCHVWTLPLCRLLSLQGPQMGRSCFVFGILPYSHHVRHWADLLWHKCGNISFLAQTTYSSISLLVLLLCNNWCIVRHTSWWTFQCLLHTCPTNDPSLYCIPSTRDASVPIQQCLAI